MVRAFERQLERLFEEHGEKPGMRRVGGNFAISIPGIAEWTVQTTGLHAGVTRGLREDAGIGCLLVFRQLKAFYALVRSSDALREAHESGQLEVHGDPELFYNYLALGRSRSDDRAQRPSNAPRRMRRATV